MAQWRWHCNYKDFPQLLMRWCFHVPASIIRLTRADFLYANQLFIGLFPPERISLLHANAAALPPPPWHRCHTRAGEQVTRSASSQNPTLPRFHPFTGAWLPFPLGGARTRVRLWYSSGCCTCFWGIIPPCERQRDEKSLWASYGNTTHKCVITCWHRLD